MTWFVKEIIRITPTKLAVRVENLFANKDDPDRYKWLAAIEDADGTVELIPAAETGDLQDPCVFEKVRSAVVDFIVTGGQTTGEICSYKRQKMIEQIKADKARRANLLKRAGRLAELQSSEKLRLKKMASDLGCTVALAKYIDGLEKRLRTLDIAIG